MIRWYLSQDQAFKKFNEDISTEMSIRIEETDKRLKHISNTKLGHFSWAVAARGSYGRGDLALHSDLDLVFISTELPQEAKYFSWYQSCKESFGRVSLQLYMPHSFSYQPDNIVFWLSLPSLRFVAGELRVFKSFQDSNIKRFTQVPITKLIEMYVTDGYRSKEIRIINSAHYHNIKRGYGAMVDNEFCRLLEFRNTILNKPTYRKLQLLFEDNKLCYTYLTLLKEFLHCISGVSLESTLPICDQEYAKLVLSDHSYKTPWFFKKWFIRLMRQKQQDIVEKLIKKGAL